MQKFYLLRSFLIIFIAAIVVGHAGADPNKKVQEQINKVMSEAMKSSDLPAVVAVGIDSKGNQFDFMKVGVTDDSRETLEEAGFTITLPAIKKGVIPGPTAENIEVKVRTPKTQGWTDSYYVLNGYSASEFQCLEDICRPESQMITIYVRGVYLPGFEVIPALSMIALAFRSN